MNEISNLTISEFSYAFDKIKELSNNWKSYQLNIGVIGEAGSGKLQV